MGSFWCQRPDCTSAVIFTSLSCVLELGAWARAPGFLGDASMHYYVLSPYLHGNRNGRGTHTFKESRSNEIWWNTEPTYCVFNHSLNTTQKHTQSPPVSVSLYSMDTIREVVRDTMTPIKHHASWKRQLHAQHHLSSNTLTATVTLHRNKWTQIKGELSHRKSDLGYTFKQCY